MSWRTEWQTISARIKGTMIAGNFYVNCLSVNRGDSYEYGKKELLPRLKDICLDLIRFNSTHRTSLPPTAARGLQDFINAYSGRFCDTPAVETRDTAMERAFFNMAALASFESSFSYWISDLSAVAKNLTERAFLHLQRTIIADKSERQKWKAAFGDTKRAEILCEQLGAVHLLSHGIWAFKANTAGERTDLVLQEPMKEKDLDLIEIAAEAMVLTEWKVVRKKSELMGKTTEALAQMKRYAKGAMGGFELTQHRYAVLLSEKFLDEQQDVHDGGFVYRHINIAIDPDPPSKK